jgi:hypothetical protein
MKLGSLVYKLLGEEESTVLLIFSSPKQKAPRRKGAQQGVICWFLSQYSNDLQKSTGTKTETTLHCSAAYKTRQS